MRIGFAVFLASQFLFVAVPVARSADPCDWERIAELKSWKGLHQFVKRFKCVDDGMRAEAYSAFVVHTLATKWETLRELADVTKRDAPFRKFVIGHIDATASQTDLATVKNNSMQRCTSDSSGLCREIAAAADQALTEIKAVHERRPKQGN